MGAVTKILLLAALLGGLSLVQQRAWASDVALWRQAVARNDTSPRAAFNYALALRVSGAGDAAVPWLIETARRAQGTDRAAFYRSKIAVQLAALELSGVLVCHLPDVQPYC